LTTDNDSDFHKIDLLDFVVPFKRYPRGVSGVWTTREFLMDLTMLSIMLPMALSLREGFGGQPFPDALK
jgi:hypothetical protein